MNWNRFKKYYLQINELGMSLDISRMGFSDDYLESMENRVSQALEAMDALEGGSIANPDENRMVGHYWLRDPDRAPSSTITDEIKSSLKKMKSFSETVHNGKIKGQAGAFKNLLVIGIGGSALGPQFVAQALGKPLGDKMVPYFFDNTDPDGIDRTLDQLNGQLGQTLALVISKSGGTPETRNGMLEAEYAYKQAGLDFSQHAVAVTGEGSKLENHAIENSWLERFPMWDWVGGRTSELATVGLLPAVLQGLDIDGMIDGARVMDEYTRGKETIANPAAMLSLMWFYATNGAGEKDMVILPYKDRLMLFSKYLQQLIMESIGKEKDLEGKQVNQGIAVYGNKGSTDQHAYVQQLREGVNNFFITFIEVLKDREGESIEVEPEITSGDYLHGLYLGTREALHENGRESMTITVEDVDSRIVGALIALYERAVGLYAHMVGINAYHQPGVEAGKKAAASTLDIKKKILRYLQSNNGKAYTVDQIAAELNLDQETELVFKLLQHMLLNPCKQIKIEKQSSFDKSQYSYSE